MAKKVIAFSIEIEGKKNITEVTQLFGLLELQLLIINETLVEINKSASELGSEGFKEVQEQISNTNSSAGMLNGLMKEGFEQFEEGNQTVKDLGNGYFETSEQINETSQSIAELKEENKDLKKFLEEAPREGEQGYEELADALDEARQKFAENREEILGFNKELRTGIKQSEFAEGSILQLRQRVSELTKEYNALGESARNGTDGKQIQANLAATTAELKTLEEAVGDNRRSVGDYGKALRGLGGPFGAVKKGLVSVGAGFKVLLANPIVAVVSAIVAGFTALVGAFKSTKEGAEFFGQAAAAVGAILDVIRDVAVTVGKGLVSLFTSPLESLKAFGSAIVTNITNRFTGLISLARSLGSVIGAVASLDLDALKDSAKDAAQAVVQVGTGLDPAQQEAVANSIAGVATEMSNEAREAANLTAELQNLDDTQRALSVSRAELNAQLVKTRAAARDENLSIGERIEKLNEVKAAEASQLALELDAQQRRVIALKQLALQSDTGKEALDELAQSEIQLSRLKEQSASKEISIQRELDRLNNKRRREAEKDQKEEEKRLALIDSQRQKLKDKLENDSLARLKIINKLSNEIIDTEIANEKDRTKAALLSEKERFRREKEQRKKNLSDIIKDVEIQRKKINEVFGKKSDERKAFEEETGAEILEIKALNNKLEIEQKEAHEKALLNISKAASEQSSKDAEEAAAAAREQAEELAKKAEEVQKEKAAKEETERKEKIEATKGALIEAAGALLDGISQIAAIAGEAEQQRFADAIQERQNNIDRLNEDLENATGLQKKFIEKQIKTEEEAQEKLAKQAEKARKEQAAAQKAIAIVQAIIGTAVAVTQALASSPPPASFILAGVAAALGAVQIATIASQKLARGGILKRGGKLANEGGVIIGPSHEEGGVPFTIAGKSGFEAEGGEAIINKKSTKLFAPLLSRINVAGGGVAFQEGGLLGVPIPPPAIAETNSAQSNFTELVTAFNGQTNAINNRIDNIKVVNSIDDFNGVNDLDKQLDLENTL